MKWSYSSHAALRRCQRLFAFAHVVASHAARDPVRRETHTLKQLQHISAWQGSVVHSVLAADFVPALRSRRAIDASTLTTAAARLAERQFAFSMAKRYRLPGMSRGVAGAEFCALFEHEYGWEIKPELVIEFRAGFAGCFENLMSQKRFLDELYAGSGHLAEVPLSFRFEDATIAATPDLVFRRSDGVIAVVDWKVARSQTSDYSMQLLVYGLAIIRSGRWGGLSAGEVGLYEVNLIQNYVRRHPVDVERLDEAEDFIYRSLMDFKALGAAVKYRELDLAEFEVAGRPTTCRHCNFGPLCIQSLREEGRQDKARVVQGRFW